MSWRHRKVPPPGPRYLAVGQVERYLGEPIRDDLRDEALAVLQTPMMQRRQAGQGEAMHVFMFVKADVAVAASALQCGENVLGVTLKSRRPGAVVDGSINEIELIVSGE